MNQTRYRIARIFLALGFPRKQKRLAEAAEEIHLLGLGEEILGEYIWEKVGDVEALETEYWKVRQLFLEKKKLEENIEALEGSLFKNQQSRKELLCDFEENKGEIETKRKQLTAKLDNLSKQSNIIQVKAREIKRRYEAAKAKLTVLNGDEEARELIESESKKIEDYRAAFLSLKAKRDLLLSEIERSSNALETISKEILIKKEKYHHLSSSSYQDIGKTNRTLSDNHSQLGKKRRELDALFRTIGKHIIEEKEHDITCHTIAMQHPRFTNQLDVLRRSIQLNHRLAILAGG